MSSLPVNRIAWSQPHVGGYSQVDSKEAVKELYEASKNLIESFDHVKSVKREDLTSEDRKRANKAVDRLIEAAIEMKRIQDLYGRIED